MTPDPEPRFFTLEEVRALVPRLRTLLTALQIEQHHLEGEVQALNDLTPAMRANGQAITAARLEERITELYASVQEKLQMITALGIEVKDIKSGLVDFPCLRDGRVIYLCWQVDEPTVAYWHEVDAGYRGRQPLED